MATIEQKAKLYDEALKAASIAYKDEDKHLKATLERIFPELCESDDEKIRKELIKFVKVNIPDEERYIAWLENQKCANKEYTFKAIPRLLEMIQPTDRAKSYCQKLIYSLEKEGYSTDAKIVRDHLKIMNGEKVAMATMDEQKPVNKVKPMYKVGDWITNGKYTLEVANITERIYVLRFQCGTIVNYTISHIDKKFHRWNINDAKNGDVLSDGTTIFIFKDLLSDGSVMSYCDYDTEHGGSSAFCHLLMNLMCSKITPANKEQCDTLMRAMSDAGFTFDFEKKELKEIEHKHFCELDNSYTRVKFPFKAKVKSSGTIVTIPGGRISIDGTEWIEYQSDAEDGYKIYKQNNLELVCEDEHNPAWSEDDEVAVKDICDKLDRLSTTYVGFERIICQEEINWLKSLKDRYTWKPSAEQIEALEHFVRSIAESGYASPYDARTNLLKSLLEQLKNLTA